MNLCDPITADVRADLCRKCPTPCEHQHNPNWHSAACVSCMIGRWGHYGKCGDASSPLIPAPIPTPVTEPKPSETPPTKITLLKLIRAYRKSNLALLAGAARRARRAACGTCPYRIDTGHAGLYGCGRCTVCGGKGDKLRMIRPWMTCREGQWTKAQP